MIALILPYAVIFAGVFALLIALILIAAVLGVVAWWRSRHA